MRNKKGFTLIELIVVIAILGILALILVPSFMGYAADAKEVSCLSNRTNIERLYKYYEAKHPNEPTKTTLTAYLTMTDGENDITKFKCPSEGTYAVDTNNEYVLTCTKHSGTSADKPEENPEDPSTPDGDKIFGTEVGKENVKTIAYDKDLEISLPPGTIIEVKFPDGIKQFIASTNVGNGQKINVDTYEGQGLIEITKEVAKEVNETFFNDSYTNKVTKGDKIKYGDKYFIAKNTSSQGWLPKPTDTAFWVEVK